MNDDRMAAAAACCVRVCGIRKIREFISAAAFYVKSGTFDTVRWPRARITSAAAHTRARARADGDDVARTTRSVTPARRGNGLKTGVWTAINNNNNKIIIIYNNNNNNNYDNT